MYRYEETLTHTPYHTSAWRLYTEGLNIGFLDLETTGLSHRRDKIILGGLMTVPADVSDEALMIQLLAETPEEESMMLSEYWEELKRCHVIITYNGDSFDLPFLKDRLRKYQIASEEELSSLYCLDLYRVFQHYCPMASLLGDLKQKTVEEALGLSEQRTDEIDGAESIKLYERYAGQISGAGQPTGDCPEEDTEALRDLILLHNRDDIHQLSRLMKILDKVDLHRVMSRKGFPLFFRDSRIIIDTISLNKKEWRIEAATSNIPRDLDVFNANYRLIHSATNHRLTVQISVMHLQDCVVADLEALPGDYTQLIRYPSYESGYLILHDGKEAACATMNHSLQIFFREVFHENELSTG